MRFEVALYDYLAADAGLEAIVGDRIYPTRLPESVDLPAVTWFRVAASRIYTYDPFLDTDAWVSARIQFDCWSRDPNEAMQLGDAIILAFSGYGGDMAGQMIGSSFVENEIDEYDVPAKFHRRIIDMKISYQENGEESS